MSISLEDVRGVLRYFQMKTGIKGYTTQQKQDTKRPFFYFEPPRSIDVQASSSLIRHRVTIHGVFFAADDEQLRDVLSAIQHWLIADNFRIQCADEKFNLIPNAWIDDVGLQFQKSDTDIMTFTVRGERFVSVERNEALIRKIFNEYEVKA